MLDWFKSFTFKPKEVPENLYGRMWRTGMWVTYADKYTGVLFKLDAVCEVHMVDPTTGLTTDVQRIPIGSLRQAKWKEIPEVRRKISKEKGLELGYGS